MARRPTPRPLRLRIFGILRRVATFKHRGSYDLQGRVCGGGPCLSRPPTTLPLAGRGVGGRGTWDLGSRYASRWGPPEPHRPIAHHRPPLAHCRPGSPPATRPGLRVSPTHRWSRRGRGGGGRFGPPPATQSRARGRPARPSPSVQSFTVVSGHESLTPRLGPTPPPPPSLTPPPLAWSRLGGRTPS